MSKDALQWEREKFFEAASQPVFPDQLAFEVTRARRTKDQTFSRDALNSTLDNVESFVLARLKAEWDRKGIAPQEMHIEVKVRFGQNKGKAKLEAGNTPWWQLADSEQGLLGITVDSVVDDRSIVDGEHRIKEEYHEGNSDHPHVRRDGDRRGRSDDAQRTPGSGRRLD